VASRRKQAERQRFLTLLRQIRVDSGLRQEDLADKLGQPQSFVSRCESGERRVDLLELREICEALGTTLADFIRRMEGGKP
jgi:transcriptional regulator with XRE-family HTH domain